MIPLASGRCPTAVVSLPDDRTEEYVNQIIAAAMQGEELIYIDAGGRAFCTSKMRNDTRYAIVFADGTVLSLGLSCSFRNVAGWMRAVRRARCTERDVLATRKRGAKGRWCEIAAAIGMSAREDTTEPAPASQRPDWDSLF